MPKIIVTIHGLDWQRGKWGGFATKVLLKGERQAVKYADEIIVLSENNKNYFKDTYNRETTFIPNGVNKPVLKEAKLITGKYNLKKDDYVLFLARIVPEKGLHYLIEAWKNVKKEITTNKKLVIAGGASHSSDYYKKIQELVNDDNSIIMTGFVQGQELEELYSNAYLYVLPSDIEGMPMSLLEALSYGNTCLVSNIEENTSILNDNQYTFEKSNINDLTNKLINILKINLKTHTSQYIKYDWDDVVKEVLKIYVR